MLNYSFKVSLFTKSKREKEKEKERIRCTLADTKSRKWLIEILFRIEYASRANRATYMDKKTCKLQSKEFKVAIDIYQISIINAHYGLRNTRTPSQLRITDTNTFALRIIDTRYAFREL